MDILTTIWQYLLGFGGTFGDLLLKVSPYFLLGAAFGAVLRVHVKPAWSARWFQRGSSSVFYASMVGALLPGCSCATMPMADGIKAQGSRLGTVTAFITISPLLSPITLFMTYAMLGWKMTVARLVVPFVFSMSLGVLLKRWSRPGQKALLSRAQTRKA